MTKRTYIEHLLNILAYDFIVNHLCIASRYWTHREIIENYKTYKEDPIVTDAPGDVNQISDAIIKKQWQRPELKYNCDRMLEVKIKGHWQPFKPEDHV